MAMDWDEENDRIHQMNCSDGSEVIWNSLRMCLETTLQYVAFLFGIASLCFWLVSHMFLLRARYCEGNGSRRQLLTLIHFCSANVFSLIGTTLCDQLGTQVLIASYFVVADVIFFIHYLYVWCSFTPHKPEGIPYTIYNPTGEWKSPDRSRGKQNGNRTRIMCILMAWLPAMAYLPLASSPWQPNRMQNFGPGRKILTVTESPLDNFGFTLGIIAMFAYALAKVPLVKDGFRQSEYLLRHFHVVTVAVLANICYILSIILFSQNLAFLINALPWLLICGVGLVFDLLMLYLIARQRRQIAREKAAARWEENRDPQVAEYEDGRDDGLEDEEDLWASRGEPRLSAIHEEDEEQIDHEQPQSTHADVNYPDTGIQNQHDGAGIYTDEAEEGQRSPLQAIPPLLITLEEGDDIKFNPNKDLTALGMT